jgi:branched-chain amino acid transport system permease protein
MIALTAPIAAFSMELFKQLLVGGLVLGSTYALLAVSFGIIYSTTGIFHFAHAVVYAATAYVAVAAADHLGFPFVPAAIAGLIIGTVIGMLIERFGYRPMRDKGATNLAVFLVALGLSIMAPNLLQIIFGPNNQKVGDINPKTFHILGDTTITSVDIVTVAIVWVLILALLLFLKRTKYGLATHAVRVNPGMAAAVGVSINRVYLMVFALGSLLAGVPAMLFMANGTATPTMGLAPVLIGFIAVFLGGVGSMGGAAVGGLLLGVITSLSGLWVATNYQPAIVFGVLFLILIIKPTGLFGRATV